jgi:hypothetical protein
VPLSEIAGIRPQVGEWGGQLTVRAYYFDLPALQSYSSMGDDASLITAMYWKAK